MSEEFHDEENTQSLMSKQYSSTGSGENTPEDDGANRITSDKDSRRILLSKLLLVLTIVASAAGIAIFAYFYTSGLEKTKFEKQFHDDAQEIIRISESNAFKAFSTLQDFSRTTTSLANFGAANESFPRLTIPDFEVRAQDLFELSKASWIAYIPALLEEEREAYQNYTFMKQGWIQDGLNYVGRENETANSIMGMLWDFNFDPNGTSPFLPATPNTKNDGLPDYYPLWQLYPPFEAYRIPLHLWVGFNVLSVPEYTNSMRTATMLHKAFVQELRHDNTFGRPIIPGVVPSPESVVFQPIFSENDNPEADVVGFFMVYLPWDIYFQNILTESDYQVAVEVKSTCGGRATFMLEGSNVRTLQPPPPPNRTEEEDEEAIDDVPEVHPHADYMDFNYEVVADFATFTRCEGDNCDNSCNFTLHIRPSVDMEDGFHSKLPVYLTVAVIVLFAFTSFVFVLYDFLVQRRNNVVLNNANYQNQIINKLFPTQVHDRLFGMKEANGEKGGKKHRNMSVVPEGARFKLNSFLSHSATKHDELADSSDEENCRTQESLADFFPACTVMFGDIKGFSAWSSVREPVQVFTLLETIYGAFDKIAKRRKILKVESVKDSYLAVAGVPTPRDDHAVVMVRFADECNQEMARLVQYLEKLLGPDTSSLSMRFGLHSGAVTAGVLRGAKARFQLFGDTVNTAARMESTGMEGRIQISDETAMLLQERGKGHWLKKRESSVVAKGKGKLQTYWASPRTAENASTSSGSNATQPLSDALNLPEQFQAYTSAKLKLDKKLQRIVEWNTEILLRLLKQIVARRRSVPSQTKGSSPPTGIKRRPNATVMDEVTEIVKLPKFKACKQQIEWQSVELDEAVEDQLEDFVANIALRYRANPFHNYEHASHVTMSVSKMLSRIVAPEMEEPAADLEAKDYEAKLHDHTYGITSDPLTQFAVVFSALIHDVDHPGVPNTTLVREEAPIATKYKNTSVAEQNSVDLAWDLLMRDEYKDLRNCIYSTQAELVRFRQWVVTTVMSTDIVDRGLKALRNARWERAFATTLTSSTPEDSNRKATIVVEHIIQASDISHTMQHWHIYLKWNEKLFKEMYDAYRSGRCDRDPSESWYQGELGFFDFYIIPLAKKLKECGVFGVSSDEYLDYALANRREWEARGRDVVDRYIQTYVRANHSESSRADTAPALGTSFLDGVIRDEVEC